MNSWSRVERAVGISPAADQQLQFSSLDPRGGSHPGADSQVELQELEQRVCGELERQT